MPSKRDKKRAAAVEKSQDRQGFVNEVQGESDRAAAILCAALLDEKLLQLLTAFLVDDSKEVGLLLDSEQPLGAFGARIRASYCLGLITREMFAALSSIKKIRNAFAHQLHGLSFDDPEIADECAKLDPDKRYTKHMGANPRQVYIHAIVSADMEMWAQIGSIEAKGSRRKVPKWEKLVDWKTPPPDTPE